MKYMVLGTKIESYPENMIGLRHEGGYRVFLETPGQHPYFEIRNIFDTFEEAYSHSFKHYSDEIKRFYEHKQRTIRAADSQIAYAKTVLDKLRDQLDNHRNAEHT